MLLPRIIRLPLASYSRYLHKTFRTRSSMMMMSSTPSRKPRVFINQMFDTTGLIHTGKLFETCNVKHWSNVEIPTREQFLKEIVSVDAIFLAWPNRIDETALKAAGSQLKVIGAKMVGYDHIDVEACRRAGVLVSNIPHVYTDAVAELTIGLTLSAARRFNEACKRLVNGTVTYHISNWMTGKELKDSVVGIVGLGEIGAGIAKRLKGFDVRELLYNNRNVSPRAAEVNAKYVDFTTLLKQSDFVIVCCPLTPATTRLFNAEAFKTMKNSAVFVNISRGDVVNHDDLYQALVTGEIWAAGLDVTTPEPLPTDHPLLTLSNCTILPHIGSETHPAIVNGLELTSRNILAALNGDPMPSPI